MIALSGFFILLSAADVSWLLPLRGEREQLMTAVLVRGQQCQSWFFRKVSDQMDYTGFGRDGKHNYKRDYKINRVLVEDEKKNRLDIRVPSAVTPSDWMSAIKINGTYLELVDRWYPIKGCAAWQGAIISIPCVVGVLAFLNLAVEKGEFETWVFSSIAMFVFVVFAWVGYRGMRFDCFRETHYPVRLNRINRKVYVYRPRDTVLVASWDNLFFCVGKSKLPLFDKSFDIRAHVLDGDGETVKDTFTLGYPYLGDRDGVFQLWEYIRRYMEEPDGVEKNADHTEIYPPVDGRREGVKFGLIATFAPASKWPLKGQLLFSPVLAITTLGRWLAMSTSELPQWPKEIEAECKIDPDDPCQKDWRSNGKYGFWELGWPVICFFIGLSVIGAGVLWLVQEIY
ncbi:hypothetical protein BJB45_08875 [Halomonas huangheensis]|uniref:DUF6708 domain-containing protein n=2 Tax=Halomonas huangheensis TaxID=1178482 RepID=W1NA25_9GAMM|nr:hypothetical protein AR456_18125 [Halomonas huangheensis]ERL52066.1 hypothetical protein BJB45_08875 [Halomonas huangheensis]